MIAEMDPMNRTATSHVIHGCSNVPPPENAFLSDSLVMVMMTVGTEVTRLTLSAVSLFL